MHGSLAANSELLKGLLAGIAGLAASDVAVCVRLPPIASRSTAVSIQAMLAATIRCAGAQNLSEHGVGAYTGEVSAAMLGEFGCRFAIVGILSVAPLRRNGCRGGAKFVAAQAAGLVPILCVGETLAQRDAGDR